MNRRNRLSRRGVTIIELLVSIAVIAVLISIILPALRGAREASEDLTHHRTVQQLVTSIYSYANDYDNTFPYIGTAGDPNAPVTIDGWSPQGFYFRDLEQYWASVLVPTYYEANDPLLNPPTDHPFPNQPPGVFRTNIGFTGTTAAAPAYWRAGEPPADPSLFRSTRIAEMASPSGKGLLMDWQTFSPTPSVSGQTRVVVGMGDGSVSRRLFDVGDPSNIVDRTDLGATPTEVFSTRDGLRGRDY